MPKSPEGGSENQPVPEKEFEVGGLERHQLDTEMGTGRPMFETKQLVIKGGKPFYRQEYEDYGTTYEEAPLDKALEGLNLMEETLTRQLEGVKEAKKQLEESDS